MASFSFPEIFEERRAQSIYTFHDIDWVIAGIKGDATGLLRNESIDRQQNVLIISNHTTYNHTTIRNSAKGYDRTLSF